LVTAGDTYAADVLIEGEQVAQIGRDLPTADAEVVDASGKLLLPGGIDPHTHMELHVAGTVSSDDYFTGHRAAAFGGTTTLIDFAEPDKGGGLLDGLAQWQAKARDKAAVDYAFHMTVNGPGPAALDEFPALVREGVVSLKIYLSYKGYQVDDLGLFRILSRAAEHGIVTAAHCENGDICDELIARARAAGLTAPKHHAEVRPPLAEAEATGRATKLAGIAGGWLYVVHVTCRGALDELRWARKQGLPVMGETCVQYLFFTRDDLARPDFEGAKFVCSPPLRGEQDQVALWEALADGTLQVLATDHCPFWFEGGRDGRPGGKELGRDDFTKIPGGVPGVENRLMLLWHYGVNAGRISPNRFVALTSTNPARIFGLYPRKGTIAPGSDADIVIWDPDREYTISASTHHMNTDYNLYEGHTVRGVPERVYLRGRLIVDGDEWLGEAGGGCYLARRRPELL
jgi:dihydropyrimidinase